MTFNGTVLTAHTLDASTGGVVFPDNTTQTTAAAPAGSDTQVQFNDGGAFAGDAGLVFNKTTNALTTTGLLTAAGATLSSTLTMTAAAINGAVRVDVASATTCAIGAAASNYVRITGTTTITGMGTVASGIYRDVVFAGALTLTYNATSLILPTAANIVTVAGDTAGFVSDGSGNWRCLYYTRASGQPVAANPVYVTMKAIAAFPFSFSYTPLRSTSILTVEVDIPSIGGTNTTNSLTVTVGASTLNTAYMQYTNLAYHASPFRVIGTYQVASAAALTIGSTLTGGGVLVPGGTVYMRVTESDGAIS